MYANGLLIVLPSGAGQAAPAQHRACGLNRRRTGWLPSNPIFLGLLPQANRHYADAVPQTVRQTQQITELVESSVIIDIHHPNVSDLVHSNIANRSP